MKDEEMMHEFFMMLNALNARLECQAKPLKTLTKITKEMHHDIELLKKGNHQCH